MCMHVHTHTHISHFLYSFFYFCTQVLSITWLLYIMLQWTLECIYLFELVFSFSSDKYAEAELLDYKVVRFFNFWGTSILFPVVATQVLFPLTVHKDSRFSTSLPILLIFLIIAHSNSLWYLTVVMTCIFLIISDVEHLFLYLLAICIVFFKKCLFRFSVQF